VGLETDRQLGIEVAEILERVLHERKRSVPVALESESGGELERGAAPQYRIVGAAPRLSEVIEHRRVGVQARSSPQLEQNCGTLLARAAFLQRSREVRDAVLWSRAMKSKRGRIPQLVDYVLRAGGFSRQELGCDGVHFGTLGREQGGRPVVEAGTLAWRHLV